MISAPNINYRLVNVRSPKNTLLIAEKILIDRPRLLNDDILFYLQDKLYL